MKNTRTDITIRAMPLTGDDGKRHEFVFDGKHGTWNNESAMRYVQSRGYAVVSIRRTHK